MYAVASGGADKVCWHIGLFQNRQGCVMLTRNWTDVDRPPNSTRMKIGIQGHRKQFVDTL
jgi:hypothetical protein